MILSSKTSDIVYTPSISGINANFLAPSIAQAGLAPDALPPHAELAQHTNSKAWSDIWSAGQGVGAIDDLPPVSELCARLRAEYAAALRGAATEPFRAESETS